MDTTHQLTKPVPPSWSPPLTSWEISLRSSGSSERTVDTRLRHVRQLARGFWDTAPRDVTDDALLTWCAGKKWMPETRHSYYASFQGFFHWNSEHTSCNDPSMVLPVVRRPASPPHPTPEDILHQARLDSDRRTCLILDIAACLGLRAGEIARIHKQDITQDLVGLSLNVHGKGGKTRIIPMPEWLGYQLLRECTANGGFAFPGQDNGHLSARWISKLGSMALPSPWTLHSLRHRFATLAYGAERDLLTVQRLLGHSSVATTQRYASPPEAAMRAAIAAADLHLVVTA
jgi:Site-specific recombinase XerD